jgi:Secretion system C-terminal sorting domain
MSKYISISIPEACHEDWDAMIPNQQGRHCNSCQKTVVDFTAMSDSQIINFLQTNKETSGCGMFHKNQIEKQILIPKKPLPWLKYFFTITLPAFLYSQKIWAQKKIAKAEITLSKPNLDLAKVVPIKKLKDSVILLEEVVVKTTGRGRLAGSYQIAGSYTVLKCTTKGKNITSKQQKEIIINDITIYPNPIVANTKMNITWKQAVVNNQFVEVFNANGALIQKEIININTKSNNTFFTLSKLVKGLYIIRVTDVKTQTKMSKEFIVI